MKLLLAVMWSMVLAACGSTNGDSLDPGDVPVYRTEMEVRIGSVEGDGADVFGRVSGLAIDADGRIYVSDVQAHEIRVFGDDGSHFFSIGRRGSGPGELASPCCLAFGPDGVLWVRDNGNARYVAFEVGLDGAEGVATVPMNHSDANRHVPTTFNVEGQLIDIGSRQNPGTGELRTVLLHVGEDGQVEGEVVAPMPPDGEELVYPLQVRIGEMVGTRYFQQPFGPRHLIAYGPGGMHADAVSSRYHVRWYSPDGHLLHTISDIEAIGPPLTTEQRTRADSMIAADARAAGTVLPFSTPERHPVISALYFDHDGRLWLERTALPGELRRVDVYDRGGVLVKQVELAFGLDLTYGVLRPDVVHGVMRDEFDVQYVVRLRVEEKGSGGDSE